MTLKKIKVSGLFNTFDHEINFAKKDIVIIIGENGVGKTTLLQIINCIFTKKLDFLYTIPFDSIELEFTKTKWIIKYEGKELTIKDIKQDQEFPIRLSHNRKPVDLYIRRFLTRVDENQWFDRKMENFLTREEVILKYGIDPNPDNYANPQWFEDIVKENEVIFIQTQRLYRPTYKEEQGSKSLDYMIKVYSDQLVKHLQENNSEFTSVSISLDSTFPKRLLSMIKKSSQKPADILDLINENKKLNEYRSLLSSVGIIDKQKDDGIDQNVESFRDYNALPILNLYINDNIRKLDVFRDTARKLDILMRIINKRFKHKKLYIDKKEGFVIKSNKEGKSIDIISLSSGEQNELIIFYQLLFRTKKNAVVLIDEPEISLHIAWQQQIINDLVEIANETGIKLIIATHSPDIIGDNWSLVQTLYGGE